jgi:hypothetical protein
MVFWLAAMHASVLANDFAKLFMDPFVVSISAFDSRNDAQTNFNLIEDQPGREGVDCSEKI